MARNRTNVIGRKFGRLLVVRDAENGVRGHRYVDCICECGERCTVQLCNLRSGITSSCGCLRREVASVTASDMIKTKTEIKDLKEKIREEKSKVKELTKDKGK